MSQDSLKPSPQTPSSPNYVPISSASNSSQSSLMSISDISQNTLSQDTQSSSQNTQASSPKYAGNLSSSQDSSQNTLYSSQDVDHNQENIEIIQPYQHPFVVNNELENDTQSDTSSQLEIIRNRRFLENRFFFIRETAVFGLDVLILIIDYILALVIIYNLIMILRGM